MFVWTGSCVFFFFLTIPQMSPTFADRAIKSYKVTSIPTKCEKFKSGYESNPITLWYYLSFTSKSVYLPFNSICLSSKIMYILVSLDFCITFVHFSFFFLPITECRQPHSKWDEWAGEPHCLIWLFEESVILVAMAPSIMHHHKGLLNGPGQNNCFLNSAVQVSFQPLYGIFTLLGAACYAIVYFLPFV